MLDIGSCTFGTDGSGACGGNEDDDGVVVCTSPLVYPLTPELTADAIEFTLETEFVCVC